jgi:indolepyruvate ferredoxin oxidoreductase
MLDVLSTEPSAPPTLTYLSGIQALVQLPILQKQRDREAGVNTAGFISGYRGSPLGNFDQALWKAKKRLEENDIRFQPGVNEELAATAVWGTQQVNLFPGAKHDGVFAIWYGKGPGADRSMDVFKHGNAAGTSPHGGVLAIVGDDHGAKSSTLPHQSDHIFAAAMIPTLNPAGVQDFLNLGLHGWAMSRFSGCWVGMRAIADTVETSSLVNADPHRVKTQLPTDFVMPPGGLNIRWPDQPLDQELRLQRYKVYAALTYARANQLNRIVIDSPKARLGIITSGKSYLDVRQALDSLGIDEALAAEIGLRVYKVAMTWPLDAEGVRHFARGLEEILVVEEKRQVVEYQLKEQLYNWRDDVRPRVIGKYDEKGEWELPVHDWLLPAAGELSPAIIARVIAQRIGRFHTSERIKERLDFLAAKEESLKARRPDILRVPHFCSGCPHNTSTKVPEGSRALAGIGCSYMALWIHPEATQTFTQMGGEGVPWVGQAPFTNTPHIFANIGDGTYAHSGLLAIRQAVAAKVPMTYKILYNDAVAMTGGQPVDGTLTVPQVVRQVSGEGVERIVVVTDEPGKYQGKNALPSGVPVRHRRDLDQVQRELREYRGVSVLVYDQTCAAEKRRRRKRGTYPDPAKRVVINDRVCEGCGDCSEKSTCMSVVPIETEFGRKREIDQSSCNKDYSCVEGFCPSFVTVEGGRLRKGRALEPVGGMGSIGGMASVEGQGGQAPTPIEELDVAEAPNAARQAAPGRSQPADHLPEPEIVAADRPYGILVTGVGGTGVVTIGALLGTAASLENKGVTVLDMAGLAQKGGPVWSHIRIAATQEQLFASRIAAGEANLVVACDIVVASAEESLQKMRAGFSRAVVNSDFSVTSDFVRTFAAQAATGDVIHVRDPKFPLSEMEELISEAVGPGRADFVPATRLATSLMGDSIAANLFMVGYAYQKGLIPVSAASILKAIQMNGVAVDMNQGSFNWGRRAARDLAAVESAAVPLESVPESRRLSTTLNEIISRRVDDLTTYQNARYAQRYAALLQRVREAETKTAPGNSELTEAVARYYYKLMAYKDEYEVARLYTETKFLDRVNATFEGDFKLVFHMAPPIWSKRDRSSGELRKQAYGPWVLRTFKSLARMRRFRNTPLDPFRYSEDRKLHLRLLAEYEQVVNELIGALSPSNHQTAVAIAAIPEAIRGYGHIRKRHAEHAKRREAQLLQRFRGQRESKDEKGAEVPDPRPRVVMAG